MLLNFVREWTSDFAFGVIDGDRDRIYLKTDFIGSGQPYRWRYLSGRYLLFSSLAGRIRDDGPQWRLAGLF